MHDGSRAPIWFLPYFIKDRFIRAARQWYHIGALNDAIKRAVDRNVITEKGEKRCSLCSRQFTSNAKPTKCSSCSMFFHKTNCLPAHSANCKPPSVSPAALPPSTSQIAGSSLRAPFLASQSNPPQPTPNNPAKRKRTNTNTPSNATPSSLSEESSALTTVSLPPVGFQIRTSFAQSSTNFRWFFLPNFGALGMVLRLGMVTTCLPKARDVHHMSA